MARKQSKGQDEGSGRLSREDWVSAATNALAHQGIEGVNVAALAKKLGVTKGSFYWHFKDREQLCDAILESWRQQCTRDLIEQVGRTEEPRMQLQRYLRMPFDASFDAETTRLALGFQIWARIDEKVRSVLAEIDDLRLRMMAQLFLASGFDAVEARARSVLAYAYMRAALSLMGRGDRDLQAQCEALLLGACPPPLDRGFTRAPGPSGEQS